MSILTVLAGSLDALVDDAILRLDASSDVVIVPTAAAFTGASDAALEVVARLGATDARFEALMVERRADASEAHFVARLGEADVVVLTDGFALHAKAVWRDTPFGEALRAAPVVVAIGGTASVLFDVMIDPRGGAPTTGLGYRDGLVVTTLAGEEQLARTRSLVGASAPLAVLGPRGVVVGEGSRWRLVGDDVVVTRGAAEASL